MRAGWNHSSPLCNSIEKDRLGNASSAALVNQSDCSYLQIRVLSIYRLLDIRIEGCTEIGIVGLLAIICRILISVVLTVRNISFYLLPKNFAFCFPFEKYNSMVSRPCHSTCNIISDGVKNKCRILHLTALAGIEPASYRLKAGYSTN